MLMVLPAWSDQVTLAHLMHHVSGIPETEDILLNKGFQPQDRVKRETLRKGDYRRTLITLGRIRCCRMTDRRCGAAYTHTREREREREREAPDTLTRRRERIAGIHGISIDTIELYERNMIDELALRPAHGDR